MYTYLGNVSLHGNEIRVYRFNLSGLMLYTIHTQSIVVKGYFVEADETPDF